MNGYKAGNKKEGMMARSMKPRLAGASRSVIAAITMLAAMTPAASWGQAASALADQQTTASDQAPAAAEQDIVVTGIRASLESAATIKRDAPAIVDAISAEDIGAFPDQNIAESLQRITGVQITRSRGEGQFATIRGLAPSFGTVLLNGQTLTSVGGSRNFDFTILSSDFISSLEVYKSPTADLQEGGISGTINIKTLKPLDIGKRRLAVNLEGIYEEYPDKVGPHVSALYADKFLDGRLGVVLGVDYSKRYVETQRYDAAGMDKRIESGVPGVIDWNRDGDRNDYYRFNHVTATGVDFGRRKRKSLIGGLQFQATDSVDVWYNFVGSKFDNHLSFAQQSLQAHLGNGTGQPVPVLVETHISTVRPFPDDVGTGSITTNVVRAANGDLISGPNGVPIAGIIDLIDENTARGINNTRTFYNDDKTISHSFGADFDDHDHVTVHVQGSIAKTTEYQTQISLEAASLPSIRVDLRTDPSGIPTIQYVRGYDPLNPANYTIESLNGKLREPYVDKNKEGQVDFVWKANGDGFLDAIRIGAKVSERTNTTGNRTITIAAGQLANLLSIPTVPITAARFNGASYMIPFGGDDFLSRYHGSSTFNRTFLATDVLKAVGQLGGFGALDTLNGTVVNGVTVVAPIIVNQPSLSRVTETVWAGYARGDFKAIDSRLTGNVGVRAVLTDQHSSGYQPDLQGITFTTQGAVTRVPAAGLTTIGRSYTDILPSLNLRFDASDKLVVRFAAAKTLTRPSLSLLAPRATVSGTALSIADTNPQLDPFRTKQLDLSVEYYTGRGSLISAALFYKDVDGLILTIADSLTLPVRNIDNGTTSDIAFVRTRPINGTSTKIKGAEINVQQSFTFLPGLLSGFGVQANYTYIDADDTLTSVGTVAKAFPLAGVSKHSYNLVGYYEKGPVSLRAAYNYRSNYVEDPVASRQDGIYVEAIGQLDATAKLKITDNFSVTADVTNLTDEPIIRTNQYGYNRGWEVNGRRVTFGARASF